MELKSLFASIANSGFVVRNKGCRIPAMDPFDSAIARFIEKEKPLICEHGSHLPLVDSNDTALYVNPNAIGHFYNNSGEIDCCWRPFWRTKDEDNVVTSVRLIILTFIDRLRFLISFLFHLLFYTKVWRKPLTRIKSVILICLFIALVSFLISSVIYLFDIRNS